MADLFHTITDSRSSRCWKSLRDSENRDERAWFLISNFIAVQALELHQQKHVPNKEITDVETVVSCFSVLFHEKFGGSANQPVFDEQNYGKSNWLILTRLMIQGYVFLFNRCILLN